MTGVRVVVGCRSRDGFEVEALAVGFLALGEEPEPALPREVFVLEADAFRDTEGVGVGGVGLFVPPAAPERAPARATVTGGRASEADGRRDVEDLGGAAGGLLDGDLVNGGRAAIASPFPRDAAVPNTAGTGSDRDLE